MAIRRRPKFDVPVADTATPINKTLAVTATAEDLAAVPGGKKGRRVSIVNEGPGDVSIAFDATATAAPELLLKEGDAYDEGDLEISTNISFINVTAGQTPHVRGILWSGDPV